MGRPPLTGFPAKGPAVIELVEEEGTERSADAAVVELGVAELRAGFVNGVGFEAALGMASTTKPYVPFGRYVP